MYVMLTGRGRYTSGVPISRPGELFFVVRYATLILVVFVECYGKHAETVMSSLHLRAKELNCVREIYRE